MTQTDDAVTVDTGEPGFWLTPVLDRACGHILALEQEGRYATELHVHLDFYAIMEELRRNERARGMPVLLFGVEVKPSASLQINQFRVLT
jgi:hypothetical protein